MKRFATRQLLLALVGGLSLFAASVRAVGPEFHMVGLAVHQETGREIYLGAIHVDKMVPRPDNLVSASGPKLMEYRVVARRTSVRSLLGTILLQSELAAAQPPAPGVTDFVANIMASVEGSLYAGDSLAFLLTEDDQTVALLNDLELARVDDGFVFDYLLTGWVGERGASTSFRGSILANDIDESLLSAYRAHQVSPERRNEVASWLAPTEDSVPEPQTRQETEETLAEQAATATTVALVDDAAAAADIAQPEAAVVVPELEITPDPAREAVSESAELSPIEPIQLAMATPVTAAVIEPELPEIARLDIMEYSRRLATFNTLVLRMVTEKIRYPKAAVRRNLQGSLELDLTLLEDGSLAEVAVGRGSGHDTLDNAAVRAAKKAFKDTALTEIDPVARAEYLGEEGQLIVPVPVNFILME